jgi:hypothetical protein
MSNIHAKAIRAAARVAGLFRLANLCESVAVYKLPNAAVDITSMSDGAGQREEPKAPRQFRASRLFNY